MLKMKKTVSMILVIAMILSMTCAVPIHAAEDIKESGYCGGEGNGDNLIWEISSDGTLTISGKGRMADYTLPSNTPWSGKNISKLQLCDGITSIGAFAFYNETNIKGTLTIPASVTEIGGSAFDTCSGFTGNLIIPDSVTTIDSWAFSDCSGFTGSLIIPDSVTKIGSCAFYNCSGFTGSLIIPDGVTAIGNRTFYNCSGFTGSLTIPNGVIVIGERAFCNCSGFTGDLLIPDSMIAIGDRAFCDCSGFTGDLIIPNSMIAIGDRAFCNCSGFTGSLIISNSVATIGEYTFGDTRFRSVNIPGNVEYFGDRVSFDPEERDVLWSYDHTYAAMIFAPTCTKRGYTTYIYASGESYRSSYAEALGHEWNDGFVALAPTENAEGIRIYICTRCGATKDEAIPRSAHIHNYVNIGTAPTCTEQGYTTHVCACDDSYEDTYVEALGHSWDAGTITLAPTRTTKGIRTHTCTRCGATKTEPIPELQDCGGNLSVCPSAEFSDVPPYGNWAHEGIDYCIQNSLMNGVSSGKFNPSGTVTRAQLVTILYRMAGEPAVFTNDTFTDVPMGKWYSNAIEWAAANNIVTGVGDGRFKPDAGITREQIATILYRYEGSPAVTGTLTAFPDHANASTYAVDAALLWAIGNGLFNGVSSNNVTNLAPKNVATRAQVASIIMRYIEGSH